MKRRLKLLGLTLAIGLGVLAGGGWILSRVLEEHETLYQGKPLSHWAAQLNGKDTAVSNRAMAVVTEQILPRLTDTMLHDTNDSSFRLGLIEQLNHCPGIFINFTPADGRRPNAAIELGSLGPPAKSMIPTLLQALKGRDGAVRAAAAIALGEIHSEPEVVVPVLITALDDATDGVNVAAAEALGNLGFWSKAAVPKLIPLTKAREKELRRAAGLALKQIDPDAFARAMAGTK